MEIEIVLRKSLHENAALHYEKAKKWKQKAKGAEEASKEMEKRISDFEKRIGSEKKEKEVAVKKAEDKAKRKAERKWYEKFHWLMTSGGRLVIGGRDAKQNDFLYNKHLEKTDLFFHADIHGAPATILKDGQAASGQEKIEAAQFAANYSSAWKNGMPVCDVYALKPDQVSKTAKSGEFLATGAFVLSGEREWFRNTELGLIVGVGEKGLEVRMNAMGAAGLGNFFLISPGGNWEKGQLAKKLGGELRVYSEELMQLLPTGKSKIGKKK